MSWWLSYPEQLYLDSQLAQNQFPDQPKAFAEQVQVKLKFEHGCLQADRRNAPKAAEVLDCMSLPR